jgi:hypothetical protein
MRRLADKDQMSNSRLLRLFRTSGDALCMQQERPAPIFEV